MKQDFYTFPAIFYYDSDGISIEFPDLPGCLPCAENTEEAFARAKEALGLHLYAMQEDGDEIPDPTPIADIHPDAGGAIVMVDAFMPAVRDKVNRRVVKKTLTIPAWLNREAEAAHVNFSQVLQDALKSYLGKYAG